MSKNKAKKNALDSQQTDTEVNIGIPSGKPVRMGNSCSYEENRRV